MSKIRKRVLVRGHVQGVFFRDSTQREAERRGVAGWVRNRDDGAVEAVFEGESEDVQAIIRFMSEGPRGANVEDLAVTDEEPEGAAGFRVSG